MTATKTAQFDTPGCDGATTFRVICEFDRWQAETAKFVGYNLLNFPQTRLKADNACPEGN